MEARPTTRGERERERQRGRGAAELLADIPRRVRLPLDIPPSSALAAVICALTQHDRGEETRHLFNALPPSCRPVLERCPRHHDVATSSFGREEMLRRVAAHLDVSRGDAEDITAGVMMAIGLRVEPAAVRGLAEQLPAELRELWVVRRAVSPAEPHPVFEEIELQVTLPCGLTGMGAFTAVMSLLSRRLSRGEARLLVDSLPLDLRPLLAEGRAGRGEPEHFGCDELFARASIHLAVNDAEPVVRAVFRAVQPYLRADVFARVAGQLPPDLQELWLTP